MLLLLPVLYGPQVAAMQRDSSTYCDEPADAEDFAAWRQRFDLAAAKPDIDRITSGEWPAGWVARSHGQLVPCLFWECQPHVCMPACGLVQLTRVAHCCKRKHSHAWLHSTSCPAGLQVHVCQPPGFSELGVTPSCNRAACMKKQLGALVQFSQEAESCNPYGWPLSLMYKSPQNSSASVAVHGSIGPHWLVCAAPAGNAFMSELQARIVPILVEYEDFWLRYFYKWG
jgi:hypothetical protein